jgi:FkbM family methyltransferase
MFVNVGALIGDCALAFINACERKGFQYKKIINFEPDMNNFLKLSEKMMPLADVQCLRYGLWSHRGRMRFSNSNPSPGGSVGFLAAEGDFEVDVISLDEVLQDMEVSLIKMDVEGAEMEALRGAAKTIRRCTPKLAISVYHKRDDIFKIPLLIHSFYPRYKFYLRHHSTTFSETVLFAVP